MADTLDHACDAARRLGWEVQRPFQDPGGPGAVLIDRSKNASASPHRGVGQPGLVYVVEAASPDQAPWTTTPCTLWGRLRLYGDPDMIDRLTDQLSATLAMTGAATNGAFPDPISPRRRQGDGPEPPGPPSPGRRDARRHAGA
jgi:hypothetical protein